MSANIKKTAILSQIAEQMSARAIQIYIHAKKEQANTLCIGHFCSYGKRGNCLKSGLRFSLNASRPSFASSVV